MHILVSILEMYVNNIKVLNVLKPGVVARVYNPRFERLRQGDLEFEVSLGHRVKLSQNDNNGGGRDDDALKSPVIEEKPLCINPNLPEILFLGTLPCAEGLSSLITASSLASPLFQDHKFHFPRATFATTIVLSTLVLAPSLSCFRVRPCLGLCPALSYNSG